MTDILPPAPNGMPPGSPFWNQWYEKLRVLVNTIGTSISWVNLNFAGSKIQDIVDRQHNNLQSIQGGSAGDYQHLTTAQLSTFSALANPNIVGSSTAMVIQPKLATTTTSPGSLTLSGGTNTVSGGTGGDATVTGGDGVLTGGNCVLSGGNGTGTNSNGGSFYMQAGNGSGSGVPGDCSFQPGSGPSHGGTMTFSGGNTGSDALTITDDGTNNMVSLYGKTPVKQATTSGSSSTFVVNAGTAINTSSTFDGYTLAQVVRAMKNIGILA